MSHADQILLSNDYGDDATLTAAIQRLENCADACGAWTDDGEEPYSAVYDRLLEARRAVRDRLRILLATHPTPERGDGA